jgi:hypothetical protein
VSAFTFVSQNPTDNLDGVLGQLGNRMQHALRAFTAKDRKAVRAAADNFRENPAFDAREAITQLGVGEALVSILDAKGIPQMVDRTLLRPPSSRLGSARPSERKASIEASDLRSTYAKTVEGVSGFEKIKGRTEAAANEAQEAQEQSRLEKEHSYKAPRIARKKATARKRSSSSSRQGVMEAMAKSVVRAIGSSLGRQLVRGLLGSFLKGR